MSIPPLEVFIEVGTRTETSNKYDSLCTMSFVSYFHQICCSYCYPESVFLNFADLLINQAFNTLKSVDKSFLNISARYLKISKSRSWNKDKF